MRGHMRHRVGTALGAVGVAAMSCLVGAPGATGVAGAASPTGWTSQSVSGIGELAGVACPTSTECFAVGDASYILQSTDGGTTWTRTATPVAVTDLADITCPSASTCYAVGNLNAAVGVILATTNGGTTWVSQALPPGVANIGLSAVSCSSVTQCVAVLGFNVGDTPVLRTTDGGATWTNEPVPTGSYDLDDVTCVPGTQSCMTGEGGLLTSTDGGATWVAAVDPPGASQTSMTCVSTSDCVVFTGSTTTPTSAFVTTDFGASWTESTLPPVGIEPITGVTCPTATDCVAVGSSGLNGKAVILASGDGGRSWSNVPVPAGTGYLGRAACATPAVCIAVGQDSGGTALIASGTPTAVSFGVTTTALPGGAVFTRTDKSRYSAQLAAVGGNAPYKWSLAPGSGVLPPGLRLSAKGVISGKATTPGTYGFTVEVVDTKVKFAGRPATQNSATMPLSITIAPAP